MLAPMGGTEWTEWNETERNNFRNEIISKTNDRSSYERIGTSFMLWLWWNECNGMKSNGNEAISDRKTNSTINVHSMYEHIKTLVVFLFRWANEIQWNETERKLKFFGTQDKLIKQCSTYERIETSSEQIETSVLFWLDFRTEGS